MPLEEHTYTIRDIREQSTGKIGTAELPNPEVDNKIAVYDTDERFQECVSQGEFDQRFEVLATRTEPEWHPIN